MWIQILLVAEAVALAVGIPLLSIYFKERVTNLARQRTDEALAEHQHRYDRLLSQMEADNQRRFHEFSLFTDKQHRVYGALYRRAKEATDRYASYFGLSMSSAFEGYDFAAATEFMERRGVLKVDSGIILGDFAAGRFEQGRNGLIELDRKLSARDASNAFSKMKNLEAMCELYLSDPVRDCMRVLRDQLAACAVVAMRPDAMRNEALAKKVDTIEHAAAPLLQAMRAELHRSALPSNGTTQVAVTMTGIK